MEHESLTMGVPLLPQQKNSQKNSQNTSSSQTPSRAPSEVRSVEGETSIDSAFQTHFSTFLSTLRSQGKSANTLRNYTSDLNSLAEFLKSEAIPLHSLGENELNRFVEKLESQGLRANSRRRKLMTLKSFLRFLEVTETVKSCSLTHSANLSQEIAHMTTQRIAQTVQENPEARSSHVADAGHKLIPPEKVEKPPVLVSMDDLDKIYLGQGPIGLGLRNRALLRCLLETGAQVQEVCSLLKSDCQWNSKRDGGLIHFRGKRSRHLPLSKALVQDMMALCQHSTGHPYVFYGYHRGGPILKEPLSPRTVEILFKHWAKLYKIRQLKPRLMRHLYILHRLAVGASILQVMAEVGLRTTYVFKVYEPFLTEDGRASISDLVRWGEGHRSLGGADPFLNPPEL